MHLLGPKTVLQNKQKVTSLVDSLVEMGTPQRWKQELSNKDLSAARIIQQQFAEKPEIHRKHQHLRW